jgi:hypothetical protein
MDKLSSYFMNNPNHAQGMPKALLKDAVQALRNRQWDMNEDPVAAEMNMALFLTAGSMIRVKQFNGEDYLEHPIIVGLSRTDSYAKKIIGILHDLVEDTDWTLEDLKDIGFSSRIVNGVDAVTSREGEKYFDFIVRCGLAGDDAIDVKLSDLKHNMDLSRSVALHDPENNRDVRFLEKQRQVYPLSFSYLVAIKKGQIEPGTSVQDFMKLQPQWKNFDLLNRWGTYKHENKFGGAPRP